MALAYRPLMTLVKGAAPALVRPYLFPVPARVLRDLLNLKAQLGEEFREDEATADLMLDLDAVANDRHPMKKLHALRYYAVRWGWPKTRVADAMSGDARRGAAPWIAERAATWRAYYADDSADTRGQGADNGGQKAADLRTNGAVRGQSADSGGQGADKVEQTYRATDLHQLPQQKARKRAGAGRGSVPVYPECVGSGLVRREVWDEWEAYRRESRKPLTDPGRRQQSNALTAFANKGHDPNAIILASIANSWAGLFEPKPDLNGRGRADAARNNPAGTHARLGAAFDALDLGI